MATGGAPYTMATDGGDGEAIPTIILDYGTSYSRVGVAAHSDLTRLLSTPTAATAAAAAITAGSGSGGGSSGTSSSSAPSPPSSSPLFLGGYDGCVFPTIVGRPPSNDARFFHSRGIRDLYVGDQVASHHGTLRTSSPMAHGEIMNWDDMEKIMHYSYYSELQLAPEEHATLISEAPTTCGATREQITQILFEVFNAPMAALINTATLATLGHHAIMSGAAVAATGASNTNTAAGITTNSASFASIDSLSPAIIVDCGDSVTNVVPVLGGHIQRAAMVSQRQLSGSQCTLQLLNQFNDTPRIDDRTRQPLDPSVRFDLDTVRDIKHKLGYIRQRTGGTVYGCEQKSSYELPDGRLITLNDKERWQCGELMFRPLHGDNYTRAELEVGNLPQMVFRAMMACESWYGGNIVLCGGNTLWPGFAERLQHDVQLLVDQHIASHTSAIASSSMSIIKGTMDTAKQSMRVKVHAHTNRQHLAWIGANVLSTLSSFASMSITKEEYDERGPAIVHYLCPP